VSVRKTLGSAPAAPVRVQLSRAKGWRMPANTRVVSRPSKFGNPHDWRAWRENWPFDLSCPTEDRLGRDAWCKERAVQAFKEDLTDGTITLPLEELRGLNVGCWCRRNEWCHGDVLLELANAQTSPEGGSSLVGEGGGGSSISQSGGSRACATRPVRTDGSEGH
jgi:hypothetical protein